LKAEIVALAKRGIPPRDIARRLRVTGGYVRVVLARTRETDPSVPTFTKGDGVGLHNLTDPDVIAAVMSRLASGMKHREVAAAVGLPMGSIATITARVRRAARRWSL